MEEVHLVVLAVGSDRTRRGVNLRASANPLHQGRPRLVESLLDGKNHLPRGKTLHVESRRAAESLLLSEKPHLPDAKIRRDASHPSVKLRRPEGRAHRVGRNHRDKILPEMAIHSGAERRIVTVTKIAEVFPIVVETRIVAAFPIVAEVKTKAGFQTAVVRAVETTERLFSILVRNKDHATTFSSGRAGRGVARFDTAPIPILVAKVAMAARSISTEFRSIFEEDHWRTR